MSEVVPTTPPPASVSDVLVTGGAGFIGSHLVDLLLERPGGRVTVLDRLSTGGTRANLEQHESDPRFRFVEGDVGDRALVRSLVTGSTAVVHAAAESHVDRSIDDPGGFVATNVVGTEVVLDACRAAEARMLMVSTDEVYGPGDPGGGLFAEDHPVSPRSPYSASKAAADLLCQAYVATYEMNVTIVRGTNAYGPRQIERVVPTYAIAALEGRAIPVYGRGEQRREFLHVRDWAEAALVVLERGRPGVIYNIGAGHELSNLELARAVCAAAGAPESLIRFVADRPGHDFRYGVAADRLMALGWRPRIPFDEGLRDTVAWYGDRLEWLRRAHPGPIVTEPREASV
ncbi:MAG TPA: NAD-dependent epimerase/dehydratase family protein [Actinomycetota bacterium]|nr:NAD-dependent epimerase/dehydratase family protein [Actinomycetota bacterium]